MDNCIEITGVETLELHLQLRKYVNRVVAIVIWLVYGAAAVRSCIRSEDLAGAIIAIVVYVPAAFLITRIPLWTEGCSTLRRKPKEATICLRFFLYWRKLCLLSV